MTAVASSCRAQRSTASRDRGSARTRASTPGCRSPLAHRETVPSRGRVSAERLRGEATDLGDGQATNGERVHSSPVSLRRCTIGAPASSTTVTGCGKPRSSMSPWGTAVTPSGRSIELLGRHEHLVRAGGVAQPGGQVDRRADVVVALEQQRVAAGDADARAPAGAHTSRGLAARGRARRRCRRPGRRRRSCSRRRATWRCARPGPRPPRGRPRGTRPGRGRRRRRRRRPCSS